MHEKELLSFIRNSRTWWLYLLSFLVPFALFFLLFRFSGQMIKRQMEDGSKTVYNVAWIAEGENAKILKDKLELHLQIELQENYEEMAMMEAIQADSLDAALVIAEDFDSSLIQQKQAKITLHYKSSRGAARVLDNIISDYRDELGAKNLAALELSKGLLEPIYLSERNYFSMSEMMDSVFETLQRSIGSLLALMLLIFGSISARYALRNSFWKEIDGGQMQLLFRTPTPAAAIFRTKILWPCLFVWENMILVLLAFALAVSFDQEAAMQNVMIQIRELMPWSKLALFVLMGLPFAFLLVGFHAFTGFWLKGWRTISNNLSLLLLIFILIMGSVLPSLGILGSLLPFFNQAALAVDLLQGQAGVLAFILTAVSSILIAFLLSFISYMRFAYLASNAHE